MLLYDKGGEEHYNIISALHKSMRNSDPDAALYWLARMLEAGEDPLYVARRLVRFASEDVGMADPQALTVVRRGEGRGALPRHARRATRRWPRRRCTSPRRPRATRSTRRTAARPRMRGTGRPSRCRCTCAMRRHKLMKELDYGRGYQYAHDAPDAVTAMTSLPESLASRRYYQPTERGFEKEVKRRLDGWAEIKRATPGLRPTGRSGDRLRRQAAGRSARQRHG